MDHSWIIHGFEEFGYHFLFLTSCLFHSRVKWVNFLHDYYIAIAIVIATSIVKVINEWPKQAPHPMNMLVIRVNLLNHYGNYFYH